VSLFAANMGYLDDVDTKKVVDFEAALHSYMATKHQALLDRINDSATTTSRSSRRCTRRSRTSRPATRGDRCVIRTLR